MSDETTNDTMKAALPRGLIEALAGPIDSAFELCDDGMGAAKDRDDCTPDEMRMRGIWHCLHYLARRLGGQDALPTDTDADRNAWSHRTLDFQLLIKAQEQRAVETDELAMVCDAYGLPHSAVGLARHLASNADLDHEVNMKTIRLLNKKLATAADLLQTARYKGTDPGLARGWGRKRKALVDYALADKKA